MSIAPHLERISKDWLGEPLSAILCRTLATGQAPVITPAGTHKHSEFISTLLADCLDRELFGRGLKVRVIRSVP